MFCCQELDRVARTFSLGLANVLAIAAPDRIAVGGGVAKMGDELFSRIRRYTEEYAFVADAGHYGIVKAGLWMTPFWRWTLTAANPGLA